MQIEKDTEALVRQTIENLYPLRALPDGLHGFCTTACRALKAKAVAVGLLANASLGSDGPLLWISDSQADPRPGQDALARRAIASDCLLIEHHYGDRSQLTVSSDSQSAMMAPMCWRGMPKGVLAAFYERLEAIGSGEAEIVRRLGHSVAGILTEYDQRAARAKDALIAERKRIARDLHDAALQSSIAVSLAIDAIAPSLDPEQASRLRALSRKAQTEVRFIVADLREDGGVEHISKASRRLVDRLNLQRAGLAEAVQALLDLMAPLGARMSLSASSYRRQRPVIESALLGVVQESIANAVRHSKPRRIQVFLGVDDQYAFACIHNDRGRPLSASSGSPGFGLAGMHERVRELLGSLDIQVDPTSGTMVRAKVPRADQDDGTES